MRTRNLWPALVASAALLGTGPAAANGLAFDFGLLPGTTIAGAPGATIGWGYEITNLSEVWLMAVGVDAGLFEHADVNAGLFDFPVIAPGDTLSVPYGGGLGLYELTWHTDAPLGFVNSGVFRLSVEFYAEDPLMGGDPIDTLEGAAEYVAVVRDGGQPVPEPGTLALLGLGVAGLSIAMRRGTA